MNPAPKKGWWKSKTIWTGLTTVVIAILKSNGIDVPEEAVWGLVGAGLVFLRTGTSEIK